MTQPDAHFGLYQELILDHNAHPHNFGAIEHPTHHAHGHNPLCGDEIFVTLMIEDQKIKALRFQGKGCAIAKSSASMMTDALEGKSIEEAKALFDHFHALLTQDGASEGLGKLKVFEGVKQFPIRVKCATLAWHTVMAAIAEKEKVVSTEVES